MHDRNDDFEELRPLGEGSRTPDPKFAAHASATPRRQRRASGETGYPERLRTDEAACRSCGAPIPTSQTKCRFCLTNHLDGTAPDAPENTAADLVGIVFALVESSTFYGAVAKGAAAGNLLVASETEAAIDEHRLIYDLDAEPAPQLADRWPALPDATTVTSATGEELLTAIRERVDWQATDQEASTSLFEESGSGVRSESRLDTMLASADDPMWLVPGLALREFSEESDRDDPSPDIPTRELLECHHCNSETEHQFHTHESLPDDTWSGQPIWECRECGACRYGPDPE